MQRQLVEGLSVLVRLAIEIIVFSCCGGDLTDESGGRRITDAVLDGRHQQAGPGARAGHQEQASFVGDSHRTPGDGVHRGGRHAVEEIDELPRREHAAPALQRWPQSVEHPGDRHDLPLTTRRGMCGEHGHRVRGGTGRTAVPRDLQLRQVMDESARPRGGQIVHEGARGLEHRDDRVEITVGLFPEGPTPQSTGRPATIVSGFLPGRPQGLLEPTVRAVHAIRGVDDGQRPTQRLGLRLGQSTQIPLCRFGIEESRPQRGQRVDVDDAGLLVEAADPAAQPPHRPRVTAADHTGEQFHDVVEGDIVGSLGDAEFVCETGGIGGDPDTAPRIPRGDHLEDEHQTDHRALPVQGQIGGRGGHRDTG